MCVHTCSYLLQMSSREPRARAWHAAVGVGDKLFIWGGGGDSTRIQTTTLEVFNVNSLSWEQTRQLKGSLPDSLCSAAVTSQKESFYSFGGYTLPGHYIDTVYEINSSTLLCRELPPNSPSHAPKKQQGSRSVYFKNKVVVYGGNTGQGRPDEVHVFNLEKSTCGSIKLHMHWFRHRYYSIISMVQVPENTKILCPVHCLMIYMYVQMIIITNLSQAYWNVGSSVYAHYTPIVSLLS